MPPALCLCIYRIRPLTERIVVNHISVIELVRIMRIIYNIQLAPAMNIVKPLADLSARHSLGLSETRIIEFVCQIMSQGNDKIVWEFFVRNADLSEWGEYAMLAEAASVIDQIIKVREGLVAHMES